MFVSCTSKNNSTDKELEAEAARINAIVEAMQDPNSELNDPNSEANQQMREFNDNYMTSLWEKDYHENEFGEKIMDAPFIHRRFPGESDSGDSSLDIVFLGLEESYSVFREGM